MKLVCSYSVGQSSTIYSLQECIRLSELIFQKFQSRKISRYEFVKEYDMLYPHLPREEIGNLIQRIDRRGLGMYALFILDNTLRERFLGDELGKVHGFKVIDNGVDNSGRLILDPANTGSKPDFLFQYDGQPAYPAEAKYCPTFYKMTFKCGDLKTYIKYDAKLYMFLSKGKLGGEGDPSRSGKLYVPRDMICLWCGAEELTRILRDFEHGPYYEVGNKIGVQLRDRDFRRYFKRMSMV